MLTEEEIKIAIEEHGLTLRQHALLGWWAVDRDGRETDTEKTEALAVETYLRCAADEDYDWWD